tara:strand:- start:1604 stop:2434 length:831 start_codon:yes stop_codon:yes gene_type:complete
MPWIKSDEALASHPKLTLIASDLGISKVEALGYLHLMWYWVLKFCDDGNITKYIDIFPTEIGWKGDSDLFVDTLVNRGFIDKTSHGKYTIHDWLDYSGKYFEKKEANRLRVEKHRQNKANSSVTSHYTDITEPLQEHYGNALEENRIEENRVEENNIGLATQDEEVNNSNRDLVFETLATVCGYDWKGVMTKDERGRLNKAVKQLKEIGATPDDITIRAENFVLSYGFNPAPQSITSLYSKLTKVQPKLTKKQLEDVQKQAINSGRWAELEKKHGE